VTSRHGAVSPERVPHVEVESRLLVSGRCFVAGVDEAGRGAWAGPLVAAAVIIPRLDKGTPPELAEVRDSKLLPPSRREELAEVIARVGLIGVGSVQHDEVDLLGVRAANELAMVRAVEGLPRRPDHLIVDAFTLPICPVPQTAIIRGDLTCLSIAAASIVAKVFRDRAMADYSEQFPTYGFASHKGYGTGRHRTRLAEVGPCELHRRSYAPVAALCGGRES
jgi:ribonuclease HII